MTGPFRPAGQSPIRNWAGDLLAFIGLLTFIAVIGMWLFVILPPEDFDPMRSAHEAKMEINNGR